MNQQNSEFELSGIQLRESRTQPRVSMSREIGEAQIVHTIFGKAKVRIIRKHDKMHRALWWAGVAGAAAIAVVVWQQGWLAPQQAESLQSADTLPAASPEALSSVAAPPAGDSLFSAASSVGGVTNEPAEPVFQTLPQKLIAQQANAIRAAEKAASMPVMEQNKPAIVARQKPAVTSPAAPSEPVAPRMVVAKPRPVVTQPGMEGKPQAAPLVDNAVKKPAGMQPAKPMAVAPATAAASATHVTQPAANSPAATVPPAAPAIKENAAPQLPAGEKTLSAPVNTSGN